MFDIDTAMDQWREHLRVDFSMQEPEITKQEMQVQHDMHELRLKNLNDEESFLIAMHRLRSTTHTSSLDSRSYREIFLVLLLAVTGGLLGKIPSLFGYADMEMYDAIYGRNASFFALLPVMIYFLLKRGFPRKESIFSLLAITFLALIINSYPFHTPYDTLMLASLHMPILTLAVLLYAYGGSSGWRNCHIRISFINLAGETFLLSVLIGLGTMVLFAITMGFFELLDIDAVPFVQTWMVPLGLFGIITIATSIAQGKAHPMKNIASVLAHFFSPLFLVVIVVLIGTFMLRPGEAIENRELLMMTDGMLAIVIALIIYTITEKSHDLSVWKYVGFALIMAALLLDIVALTAILSRLFSYGLSVNKIAALGANILLFINLALLAIGYIRVFSGRQIFLKLVCLQMNLLSLYVWWAAMVVFIFPLLFSFS